MWFLHLGLFLIQPRSLLFLKYTYSKLDPHGYEERLERVKKALYALFEEYKNKCASTNLTHFSSNVSHPPIVVRGEREKEKLPTYDVSFL